MQSMDSLAHHPLLVSLYDGFWACNTLIPDATEFQLQLRPPTNENTFINFSDAMAMAKEYLSRRGVRVHRGLLGLLDFSNKRILLVDSMGELGARPVLVLVVLAESKNVKEKEAMRVHSRHVFKVVHEVYRIHEPLVATVWVYGAGRVEGDIIDCHRA
jgi:hypothetical protein